jgi:ribosomal protein S18 acetylase RimI-like enzyme
MLRTARSGDAEPTVGVLVRAFAGDPVLTWLFPEPEQYRTLAPSFFGHVVDRALATGTVTLAGEVGVAVWLKGAPDEGDAGDAEDAGNAEALGVFGEAAPRLLALAALLNERHPDEPHSYLPFLGVAPEARGTGVGSALLEHGLHHSDTEGVGACLEATSWRNRALYERHGFAAQALPIHLPQGPQIYPMWRKHPDEDS